MLHHMSVRFAIKHEGVEGAGDCFNLLLGNSPG